jgi:spore germination protein YaaH
MTLKTKFKVAVLVPTLLLAVGAILAWWLIELPLVTPLTTSPAFRFMTGVETPSSSGKLIYGFLPYWNTEVVTLQPEMTHLAYFSLTILSDGRVQTQETDHVEPGYHRLQSETFLEQAEMVKARGGQVELVLTQFNNDDIVALLASPTAHQRLLNEIDAMILAYPITGLNIDIEYSGEVTTNVRQNLVKLVAAINDHLEKKYDHINLSIDMYAGAADDNSFWDVGALQNYVDYIVIMAYDFHRRSSPQAGPVAPLFGGKKVWDSDINQHLQNFVKKVPRHKLLLGVPFYGYEWQTISRDPQAHTFPDTGATASFKRVQEVLARKDELNVQEHWNEEALSPYLSYEEDGEIYVVYYENSRSLSYKLDYVNQLDLGGVAIWALGYEGDSRELWDVIERKL